jgi:beta-lactamase superfamily II metal-dependent hydrolase
MPSSQLRTLFHNVGHGQAVHLFTPDGKVIVIDLGCSADFSPLTWLATHTKVIDLLIITHPHGDHLDEILLLKKLGFTVRQFWRPKWLTRAEVYSANQPEYAEKLERYFELSESYNGVIASTALVGNPDHTGGVRIHTHAAPECGRSNINNHSGVVAVTHAGSTLIIPGDNEPPSWRALLAKPDFAAAMAAADVFMASHHGRESGFCADLFMNRPKPRLFVISDGRVKETDATSRYSANATGWLVHSRANLPSTERKAVTTRSDGYIEVHTGYGPDSRRFLSVTSG